MPDFELLTQEPEFPDHGSIPKRTFVQRLRYARSESTGNLDYCKRVTHVIVTSAFGVAVLAVVVILPFVSFILGAKYVKQCPVEKHIPVFLIVFGCVGVFLDVVNIIRTLMSTKRQPSEMPFVCRDHVCTAFNGLFAIFLFAWFIAGNVWVFQVHLGGNLSHNPLDEDQYCHEHVYYFSFWIIISTYILVAVVIAVGLVFSFTRTAYAGRHPPQDPADENHI